MVVGRQYRLSNCLQLSIQSDMKLLILLINITKLCIVEPKARIGKSGAAYLQLKNIWNSKQLSVNCQHQNQNYQYKCQHSSTVWGGNLENYESNHPEDIGVY
ncbi:unnamed protein product [Schistosoma margrebowiei]|uniref:Uncharacterized protein n=1 Tax=Schistosoma margrebowiei TaxID=48269 RepID=A0A183N9P1_9TREM|nr:unnamed protein product [Schistosoma margrebowiei]